MKKQRSFMKDKMGILTLCLLMFCFLQVNTTVKANDKFSGYIAISTPEELENLKNGSIGQKYYLANDIDMGMYGVWNPAGVFRGTFDGNGHVIKNLRVVYSGSSGMFNRLGAGAEILNLGFENIYTESTGGYSTGGIAGFIDDSASGKVLIKNCFVKGNVYGNGGIIGINDTDNVELTIDGCHNFATIHYMNAGGIIGVGSNNTIITNCINSGILNEWRSGGIIGKSEAKKILNCVNYATETAYESNGGIIGTDSELSYMYNCYFSNSIRNYRYDDNWYITNTSYDSYTGQKANMISESQFKVQSTFGGFDFKNTWKIDKGINDGKIFLSNLKSCYQLNKVTMAVSTADSTGKKVATLTAPTANSKIYYTLDGSTPNSSSKLYTGPITLDKTVTLKAVAVQSGYKNSDIVQNKIIVSVTDPTASKAGDYYLNPIKITLTTKTNNASIYYTLDGTNPTSRSLKYNGSITISKSTRLKFIAIKNGCTSSKIISENYEFPTPWFEITSTNNNTKRSIELFDGFWKGKIYYTLDGKTPTTKSKRYTDPFTIDKTTTVKFIVAYNGQTSKVFSKTINIAAIKPVASKKSSTFSNNINVTLSTKTKGATIYYTTDGKTPTIKSKKYTKAITISKNTTLKYIAVKNGCSNSSIGTTVYKFKASAPTVSNKASAVNKGSTIKLTSKTSGVKIYYTTNGKKPTTKSTRYTKPIKINKDVTIKAIAVKNGYTSSNIVTKKYTVKTYKTEYAKVIKSYPEDYQYTIYNIDKSGAPELIITDGVNLAYIYQYKNNKVQKIGHINGVAGMSFYKENKSIILETNYVNGLGIVGYRISITNNKLLRSECYNVAYSKDYANINGKKKSKTEVMKVVNKYHKNVIKMHYCNTTKGI